MGQKSKKQRNRTRHTDAAPASSMRRRLGFWGAAVVIAITALLSLLGYQLWQRFGPGLEAVRPSSQADLNPQLVQYLPRFIEAVDAKPRDFARHSELGLVYEANQFWNEARACFENAVKLAPSEELPRLHLAIVQNQIGDTEAALATLRELTRRAPSFAPGQHRLGTTALASGDLAEAEGAFERVIALSPGAPEGYIGLADVKVRSTDFLGAKALLDKALAMKPEDGTAHHLMALTYIGLGREEDAQREMALGVRAGSLQMSDAWSQKLPAHATGLPRQNARAIAFMNAGKLEEAANIFLESLRYYPDNPDLLNNLSIVRTRQGRLEEVLPLLRRASAANPRHHQTYSNIATYFHTTNNTARGVEEMGKALALAPADASYHRKIASMLSSLGRYPESRQHWAEATKYEPSNATSFVKLAEVCLHLGLRDEAREAVERAQRLAPNDPSVVAVANQLNAPNPRR
jgi:tetratricopeptide (TPR) repeat protein